MTELSDELLVAYVDGQLERKQSRAVEKVLEQDDVIARRVHALKNAHSRLEAAFESILAGEEAIVAPPPAPQGSGFFVTWASAAKIGLAGAGLVTALVLALAGYGWPLALPNFAGNRSGAPDVEWTGSLPSTWQDDVARAQALLELLTAWRIELAVEIGVNEQARIGGGRCHDPPFASSIATRSINRRRARASRDITVPIGTLVTSAISL